MFMFAFLNLSLFYPPLKKPLIPAQNIAGMTFREIGYFLIIYLTTLHTKLIEPVEMNGRLAYFKQ